MKIRLRLACIRDQAAGVKEVVFSGPKPATEQDHKDRAGVESVTLAFRTKDAGKVAKFEVGDEYYLTLGESLGKKTAPAKTK